MKRNTRLAFDIGWIDWDLSGPEVRVADRLLPAEIEVNFPGAKDQPSLRMRLAVVDGVPQCRSLTIEAKDGGRQVRTTDVRAVALEDWVETLYSYTATVIIDEVDGQMTTGVYTLDEAELRKTEHAIQKARATSRRTITDDFLAEVATVYRAHVNDRPVEAVRAATGAGSYRTASMYVQRARAAGLLPATSPGKRMA